MTAQFVKRTLNAGFDEGVAARVDYSPPESDKKGLDKRVENTI